MAKRSSKDRAEVRAGCRTSSIEIEAERAAVVNSLRPVVELLGSVLGPNIEVALHDLTQLERSVIYIVNGHITGRTVGSSALRGPKDDLSYAAVMKARSMLGQPGHEVIQDYPTESAAGVRLRSSTVIFRDANGFPFAALCVNADMTIFEMAHSWLDRVLHRKPVERPAPAEEPQLDELLSEIIDDSVNRLGRPVSLMNKEERMLAVQAMTRRGIFIVKGGVDRAALALGVSRHTVYNYLEELRQREDSTLK
jgi:predicted transcriptional regulator YheO